MWKSKVDQILMCRPDYFAVEYQINPWMKPGTVNRTKARRQWQNLMKAYEKLGIGVKIIESSPTLPDMVFACDQGLVHKDSFISGQFKYRERQPETQLYWDWFSASGYQIIKAPTDVFLEGGEALTWAGKLLLGTGFRTSLQAGAYLAEALEQIVIPLKLVNKFFYHLDTCLFPLNQDTIFFYPPAFAPDSRALLRALAPQLIELSEVEAKNFAANSVTVGDKVLLQPGCPEFCRTLDKFGYRPVEVDVSEFNKAGGGIHCLTLRL